MSRRASEWDPPRGSLRIWDELIVRALETYSAFRTRWRSLPEAHRRIYVRGWGSDTCTRTQEWFEDCWEEGDFDLSVSRGVRYTVRLRSAPEEDALTSIVLQPHDPYIVLEGSGEFLLVRRISDGVEGFIRAKNATRHKTTITAGLPDSTPATTWSSDKEFSVPGLTEFDMPASLRSLLLMRVTLINQAQAWTHNQAFLRDVFKEGRMVNYGAKSGREILSESCACPMHPLTEHILRLINYPLPKGPEPWRRVSIVYNKYCAGQGCMSHKNWAGTSNHCYLHFSEGDASCRFTFYRKRHEERVQSRRLSNQVMVLGPAVDRDFLHSVADIRGGVHYSMVVRWISDDWEEWRNFKLKAGEIPHKYQLRAGFAVGPEPEEGDGDSESDDDLKIISEELHRVNETINLEKSFVAGGPPAAVP